MQNDWIVCQRSKIETAGLTDVDTTQTTKTYGRHHDHEASRACASCGLLLQTMIKNRSPLWASGETQSRFRPKSQDGQHVHGGTARVHSSTAREGRRPMGLVACTTGCRAFRRTGAQRKPQWCFIRRRSRVAPVNCAARGHLQIRWQRCSIDPSVTTGEPEAQVA